MIDSPWETRIQKAAGRGFHRFGGEKQGEDRLSIRGGGDPNTRDLKAEA